MKKLILRHYIKKIFWNGFLMWSHLMYLMELQKFLKGHLRDLN